MKKIVIIFSVFMPLAAVAQMKAYTEKEVEFFADASVVATEAMNIIERESEAIDRDNEALDLVEAQARSILRKLQEEKGTGDEVLRHHELAAEWSFNCCKQIKRNEKFKISEKSLHESIEKFNGACVGKNPIRLVHFLEVIPIKN